MNVERLSTVELALALPWGNAHGTMLPARHRRARRKGTLLPALCGGSLLLLYLFTATPLAPLLTVALAETDPNHRVTLRRGAGILQVVLRHDCPVPGAHHHGLIARALTALAQPASPAQPDHVIQFENLAASLEGATLAMEPVPELTASDAPPAVEIRPTEPEPSVDLSPAVAARPPPAPGGRLLSLRSILLLI
jgi:hypothetical protein